MTLSNTASLSTNLNVDPYYDDFDESKNFHRILFRPGMAVQARELTQLQTILQNQVDRFGEHIFKEGSVVSGCEVTYDRNYSYVKVLDNSSNGSSIALSTFSNQIVTGGASGVKALVVNTSAGAEANTPDLKTLHVKYTQAGSNNTAKVFTVGEALTSNNGYGANVSAIGVGSAFSVKEGVIFAKDHFIRVAPQTLILNKYDANTSLRVGFTINETVVDSDSDSTLNDPAQGSYNYAAPGANRLKITVTLAKKSINTTDANNFVEIYRTNAGLVEANAEKTQYAVLRDYLARRTRDESGDYIVNGLTVSLKEHLKSGTNQGVYTAANGGNTNKLAAGVEPGKAYVQGYDYEKLITTYVPIDKGTDYESIEATTIPTNYGNYVTVKEVCGQWDVNFHVPVSLRDIVAKAVSNNDFSTTTAVGAEIGTARVRAIEYASGTKGSYNATYKMYLYDIRMTSGAFTNVKSVYLNNATNADCKADIVLTSGNAVLSETSFNRAVYTIPATNIRRLRDSTGTIDTNFKFLKKFDVTIATDGTFTLATGSADEQFPYSTGALNSTQKQGGFYVVTNAAANTSVNITGTVSATSGSNTITGSGTAFSTQLNIGDQINIGNVGVHFVTAIASATSLTILSNAGSSATGVATHKEFDVGQVIDMSGYGIGGARTITVGSTTSATFDTQETFTATKSASVLVELNKIDGQEKAKVYKSGRYVQILCSNNTANTVGPWNLGLSDGFQILEVRQRGSAFTANTEGTDVTTHFELDTGMRDNLYDHAKLVKKSSSALSIASSDYLLVKLDYFTHDTSQGIGYFSVDSYPIDDVDTANTSAIQTAQIPIFVSPVDGKSFDLRDSIDIRPRITDSATDTTLIGSATLNPNTMVSIVQPSGGLHYSPPNDSFTVDLDYYLSRRDLIVLDNTGNIRVIKGTPSLYPYSPQEPSDGMTLAKVKVAPYPSLPTEQGRRFSRPQLVCEVTPIKNSRYTMRDIGAIKDRVDRLEYYTSLSLLEKDTKSLLIADVSGNDRFKNGILIDNFTGHNIGNVYDNDYSIAVDSEKKEARPTFKLNSLELFKTANTSGLNVSANDATVVLSAAGTYTNGEAITVGSSTSTLRYQVGNTLYLEAVTGTITPSANAVGGSSGTNKTISTVSTPSAGQLVTLPYTHSRLINQKYASSTRNAAGLFYNWAGKITLSPDSDYWTDTTNRPDVQLNFDLNTDNWVHLSNSWGTQWNDWETIWSGSRTINEFESQNSPAQFFQQATVETTERQIRTGIKATVTPFTTTQNIGGRVVNVSIVPFMRSRVIQFTGEGFKPNSKLFSFFDGTDVTAYVTPTNSSFANTANEGGSIVVNSSGNVYGLFRIPNETSLRFRTGEKIFRLSDSSTNSSAQGSVTTAGQISYTASGIIQEVQDTIVSTRQPSFATSSVSEERTVSDRRVVNRGSRTAASGGVIDSPTAAFGGVIDSPIGYSDPIAQTFRLDDTSASGVDTPGAFVTKVDLFFSSKDSTYPLFVEIREVDPSNGYVTDRVVPFSRVTLQPSSINTSSDSSAPTPVVFESPVYLLNGFDYAIVIRPGGNNSNVNVWVSRLGELDLVTGDRISKQPFAGILFASSNDRVWQPIQEEDVKFSLYVASFTAGGTGNLILKNEPRELFTVANVSSGFTTSNEVVHGDTSLVFTSQPSVNVAGYVVGSTSGANGDLIALTSNTAKIRNSYPLSASLTPSKFTAGETVTVYHANGLTTGVTGVVHSETIPVGKVAYYDTVNASNTYLHLSNTSGTFVVNNWIKGQANGQQARIVSIDNLTVDVLSLMSSKLELSNTTITTSGKFAKTTSTRDTAFIALTPSHTFNTSRLLMSRTNEVATLSSEKSMEIKFAFTTNSTRHSPVVDLSRVASTIISNVINNDSTGEANTAGGNATARYITRKVTLADNQDAEDLKVYLTAYQPATSTIRVYYKILNSEDGDLFSNKSWVAMTQVTSSATVSDGEDREDFKEYEYTIPTANLTGGGGEVQYVNSQSVTFTGYKYFAIKVVLLSSTTANPPRVRDMRAIALQI